MRQGGVELISLLQSFKLQLLQAGQAGQAHRQPRAGTSAAQAPQMRQLRQGAMEVEGPDIARELQRAQCRQPGHLQAGDSRTLAKARHVTPQKQQHSARSPIA